MEKFKSRRISPRVTLCTSSSRHLPCVAYDESMTKNDLVLWIMILLPVVFLGLIVGIVALVTAKRNRSIVPILLLFCALIAMVLFNPLSFLALGILVFVVTMQTRQD